MDREEINHALEQSYNSAGLTVPDGLLVKDIPTINDNSLESTTARFSGASWFDKIKKLHVLIIGLGGIGSWTVQLIAKLHPSTITCYDDDCIEEHNIGGQLCENAYGKSKTQSAYMLMTHISDYTALITFNRKYNCLDNCEYDIVISCVDNMDTRREIYNHWFLKGKEQSLYIDGRLAAEYFQVFCLTKQDFYHQKVYEQEWLFKSKDTDPTICSYKQTAFTAAMIGSIINNLVVNYTVNRFTEPIIPRDLPFLTSYDASLMYLKTES